jgi:hypothetical protein
VFQLKSSWSPLNTIINSGQVDRLLKDYLEAKLRSTFDYLAIEGKMTPDPNGDIGVTGNYRKKLSDKNVFFTATINVEARTVKNLREY